MNLPTKITLSRIVLVPVFIFLFLKQWWIASAITFMLLAMTDFLDGHLARKLNQCTTLGAFLDPIADKVLVIAAMFLIITLDIDYKVVLSILFILCIARDQVISGFRLIGEAKKITVKVDKLGKAKTAILDLGLTILILSPLNHIFEITGLSITILGTILSLASGTNYILKNKAIFN
jgi:CDP-diacylglycerol--glycerol-3-phosphate 3-phosphatidyltransferase